MDDARRLADDPARGLGEYYDRLTRWTGLSRLVAYGGGREALTSHRALADPRAGSAPTPSRLHDLLIESLPGTAAPRVLDAGCGLGGTMIDLARRLGGEAVGITLSDRQAAVARRAIEQAGLAGRVSVRVGSYDAPPPGPFDLVLAVESIAHSGDPLRSLTALAGVLARGGRLALVDDLPEPSAAEDPDLAAFKSGWRCPVLCDAAWYRTALTALGLEIERERDLTSEVRPRTLHAIRRLERLNRLARRARPPAPLRALLDSYMGGLALERLYRRGLMRYVLIVARRP